MTSPIELSGNANLWVSQDVSSGVALVSEPVNVSGLMELNGDLTIVINSTVSGTLKIECGHVVGMTERAADGILRQNFPSETVLAIPDVDYFVFTEAAAITANTPYTNNIDRKVDYIRLTFTPAGTASDALSGFIR